MQISLIAKRDDNMTGLRRYTDTLRQHLIEQSVDVQLSFPRSPLPGAVERLLHRAGWDLATALQNYPVRVYAEPAAVYHLTSETLATMLVFQNLAPTIVTVHAFFTYFLGDDPDLSMYRRRVDRWFDLLAVRGLPRAQAIIAVSEYVKSQLVQRVGIPSERIHVIPEAVDHDVFYPAEPSADLKARYGLPDGCRYLLYVGSEQPRKNFLLLLRAFACLKSRISDVRLLKVGQPEVDTERQKALALIDELGLHDDVIFCGHVGQDLPAFYRFADLFVFPSLYEGFGFPPLEAMACGTPVVCSNTTSLPEVVGDAALLFDPEDEDTFVELMARALSDGTLAQDLRRRGLENAHRFRWSDTAARTADLYRQVAQQSA